MSTFDDRKKSFEIIRKKVRGKIKNFEKLQMVIELIGGYELGTLF